LARSKKPKAKPKAKEYRNNESESSMRSDVGTQAQYMTKKKDEPVYGPGNPHPFSKIKTELIWDGKYDEFGNRREIDIAGLSMPMQKIETVDQPRSEADATGKLDLFEEEMKGRRRDDFRNMLIWGDNKLAMASLLIKYKSKLDLIYIDPPFDVGADFKMGVTYGDGQEEIQKDQSTLEMVAYRDMWGMGIDSYLQIMYERLILMRELLTSNGSIYVHCDSRMDSCLRLIMDEIFGGDNFVNNIQWKRTFNTGSSKAISQKWPSNLDTIFYYRMSKDFKFNRQYRGLSPGALKRYDKVDEDGRIFKWNPLKTVSKERLKRLLDAGEAKIIPTSKYPVYKQYLDESKGALIDCLWNDLDQLSTHAAERTGYASQKPENLIERIICASTNEGDLVGDFFCGSGTTGASAEKLGRRWIMADLGRFAIHTSRKRLIGLQRKLYNDGESYRSFDVFNLGRYERQWWQKERLQGADEEHRRVVLEFFKAEILKQAPSPFLHGRKAGSFCHVDNIDSIFTREEAKEVAKAAKQAGGREIYCLAWEFEMDLRQYCLALEAELGVKLKLIPIPREIMEKNRTSPPPFLEMAVLEAEPVYNKNDEGKRTVDIKIKKFLPSLAEVPSKELEALKERAVKSGNDFIDFWAIDFKWQPGKPFNHHWQDFRTRKDRKLKTVSDANYIYPKKGKYTACVKVVDTFGCDTSITVEVKV